MIPHVEKIGVFLLILVMSGCATRQVVIDQAVIRNETRGVLTQVKVLHEPTMGFGEVLSILPQSSFDLGFSKQPLRGEKAIVTWTSQHGQKNKVELILPRSLSNGTEAQSLRLVYTIYPSEYVTVELKE